MIRTNRPGDFEYNVQYVKNFSTDKVSESPLEYATRINKELVQHALCTESLSINTTRLSLMISFLKMQSQLSKCTDKRNAAIILNKDLSQIYSIGVNGGPPGQQQCLCNSEKTRYGCTHAEVNALVKNMTYAEDKIMLTTMSPCVNCATAILNHPGSFKYLIFIAGYKDTTGLDILTRGGVTCHQWIS